MKNMSYHPSEFNYNFWGDYVNQPATSAIEVETLKNSVNVMRSKHSTFYSRKDCIIITAEVPGIDKQDISITFSNIYLNIKVENHGVYADKNFQDQWCVFEKHINVDKIWARLEKGILTIMLPFADKYREISIS
jgi:HSP20 family molecular chaperone IbpA